MDELWEAAKEEEMKIPWKAANEESPIPILFRSEGWGAKSGRGRDSWVENMSRTCTLEEEANSVGHVRVKKKRTAHADPSWTTKS